MMRTVKHRQVSIKAQKLIQLICAFLFLSLAQPAFAENVSAEGFRAWVASFRPIAIQSGIRAEVYDQVTRGLTPDFSLPDLDIPSRTAKQPGQAEFVRTPGEYLREKYLTNLASQGRRLLAAHKDTLGAIAKTYGADPHLLLALWGRETAFGTYNLPHHTLQVLATQAFAGRRKELFQRQ
ncbi:MAG: lytic murein transglycosylase, partial [Rhodomicrobium sp.]|nr:lytic murein transglycosylase [Rhodomicrobium sp.]